MDATSGVDLLDRHDHAVTHRHAPEGDRTTEILMCPDYDLVVADTLVRSGCSKRPNSRSQNGD